MKEFVMTKEVEDFLNSTVFGANKVTEIALEGEPGCGKTLATRFIAEKIGHPERYLRIVVSKETSIEHFTTEKIIKDGDVVEQDSQFLRLIQEDDSVCCVDEWMLGQPDVMAVLNSLLDYDRSVMLPNGRVVKRSPTNVIVFTSNPRTYAGVKRQHGGLTDRLPTLVMGYVDARTEVKMIHDEYPKLPKEDIAKLVKFATFIRNGKGTKALTTVCSTRGILSMAQMMSNGATIDMAVRAALKVPEEETKIVNELMLKAMNASFVKNEQTGEDELVLNDKLMKERDEYQKKANDLEAQVKQWREKATAMFEALS